MRRLAFLAITLSAVAAYSQAPAIPTPPKEHPRLYVRAADLPQIREHIRHPRLEPVWTKVLKTSRTSPDGLSRDDTTKLIAAQALVHLINKDEATGGAAIALLRNFLPRAEFDPTVRTSRATSAR